MADIKEMEMMKNYFRLFIAMALLFSVKVFAIPYPIISNFVAADNCGGCTGTFNITQTLIDTNPVSMNVVATQPVGLGFMYVPTTNIRSFSMAPGYVMPDGHSTIAELALKAYEQGQKNLTYISAPNMGSIVLCAGYLSGDPYSHYNFPASLAYCASPPPINQYCKITSEQLVIDHGTLTASSAEGATGHAFLQINCTQNTTVKFSLLSGQQAILLSPSGQASLTIANQPLGETVSLLSGDNQLHVTDTLSGVSEAGLNAGTDVIVLGYN
ncbi:hypothetical protein [Atlantibacter hermannii]|nr:hypothetical protein [Atlantibacter hermannii]MCQ4969054.1 hypothetical protein [Enterobacteriaceae bacterium DFI.7.85]MDU7812175.1 hypothetical protein [Atlantibacter hermannii]QPS93780.1 hypothetical protein I6G45_09980 [Atlantibacter hermannii]